MRLARFHQCIPQRRRGTRTNVDFICKLAGEADDSSRIARRLWLSEKEYDPKWDGAVRDWARTSQKVLDTVHAVDQQRIGYIEQVFQDLGYKGKEANVRARVTYYHQVGYYALGMHETRKQRLELIPYYIKILTQREA